MTNADHNNGKQDSGMKISRESSKGVKPPPFYLSLIIGDKLVHNCMVDSGATSSVMPKKLVDQLGLKYQPVEKGVVQLDGTSIHTIGLIKDVSLTLHACPNFSIQQDVYVIDLPPYFVVCLVKYQNLHPILN